MVKVPPIPSGWSHARLSAIIDDLPSGVSVNGEDRPASKHEVGVLKVSSVSNGRFFPSKNKVVVGSEVDRLRMPVSGGDLLISRSNTFDLVGASGIAPEDYPNLFLPDKLWKVVLADVTQDCNFWLLQLLNSNPIRRALKNIATGTSGSMKNIAKPSFLSIRVYRPPLSEQRKIAAILSTWDRAIELTEKLIAAKQQRKQSLMQKLVDRPSANWPMVTLGELFANRKLKGRPGLPTYSVTMNDGLVLRDSLDRKNDTSLDHEQHLLVEEGDIAYNMMRMWQGASGLATESGLVSPAYVVVRSRGKVDPAFASYWFKTPRVVKKFQDYSHGLTKDRLRLYFKDFSSISLPLPPIDLQRKIANTLKCCDHELNCLQRKVATLKQQKKGLMQQLLTGKTRVNVDEEACIDA